MDMTPDEEKQVTYILDKDMADNTPFRGPYIGYLNAVEMVILPNQKEPRFFLTRD